ncbi:SHOCT domain-containing protein [Pyxidicoccus parkwayensis]|uniref:SHOCT domain-containing protein n=1 Tax=Pyxidicoccus parkwayensis TaxID=2813578 RepID=A0ABX7NK13_9BACT|nr:DUF3592 domain-containing protein [Pyxidicoccus parkwaysis]QSQ19184.1 SHOCT domain-containing protein [Pyxidicoccus parkwaysis]
MKTLLLSYLPLMVGLFFGVGAVAVFVRSHMQARHLREHGTPAEATVLQMNRTAMRINKRTVYDFLLEVRVPGRPAYQVRCHNRAHDWNVFFLEPGVRLKVNVDPVDPQRFVVLGPVSQQRPRSLQDLVAGIGHRLDPVKALRDLQTLLDEQIITQDEYTRKKSEILARM